jgi:hypothetical protein
MYHSHYHFAWMLNTFFSRCNVRTYLLVKHKFYWRRWPMLGRLYYRLGILDHRGAQIVGIQCWQVVTEALFGRVPTGISDTCIVIILFTWALFSSISLHHSSGGAIFFAPPSSIGSMRERKRREKKSSYDLCKNTTRGRGEKKSFCEVERALKQQGWAEGQRDQFGTHSLPKTPMNASQEDPPRRHMMKVF